MTDNPGQPKQDMGVETGTTPDAEQTVSFNTVQAAKLLGVDSRTVRRYITEGIHTPAGIVTLVARQVRTNRGQEYQVYQTDLDDFKHARDRAATEGQAAGQLTRHAAEESQNQNHALMTSTIQIIAGELERRNQALIQAQATIAQAQATIERLAREAGRNEALEREREWLQRRVDELTKERDHWQQKAKKSYRIRLFPIED